MTDRIVAVAATVDASHLDYLAVMLRSAADRLTPGWRLRTFVIGYEIDDDARRRFETRLAHAKVETEWRTLELAMVRGRWPGAAGGGVTLYYRLYLAEALPDDVERILFLDVDLHVEGDLVELWRSPFDGHIVQAVPDAYADKAHLPRLSRIDFPRGPRFDASTPYFNAGVLLIDLARWRRENIGAQAAGFLWAYGERLSGRDQDALNLALFGRWKPLSAKWNFHEIPGALRSWRAGADTPETLREAILRPSIVHFIGCKPWAVDCRHAGREAWRSTARAVGVRPNSGGLAFRLFRAPLYDLQWRLRRGVFQAQDAAQAGRAARLLLARPWLALTYPIWRALQSVRRRPAAFGSRPAALGRAARP